MEDVAPVERAPAIRTRGLTKHFGPVRALVDVDLDIARGEVFGFLGPNGAGKTTMIRTLLDELRPTAGRAWILGMDARRESVRIRSHLGYVPGDLTMYPKLTGHDTLAFFANLRGGVDWNHVHELAERLNADLDRKVGDLSTGNRHKIGVIQALMNRPTVLIMDEPSTGLDPLVQREFQSMLREIADEGRTVFLSSHSLGEVERVADRVGIIREGRLVAVEPLETLRRRSVRRVEIEFDGAPPTALLRSVPGVGALTVDGGRAIVTFEGRMGRLLRALSGHDDLVDITTREADLEDVFLRYYLDGGVASDPDDSPTSVEMAG